MAIARVVLLALAALAGAPLAGVAAVNADAVVGLRELGGLSPITRVVELLKALAGKVEAEGKTEETLYEKFMCWGSSVVDSKTQSNSAAKSRADSLSTYIADIDAGRLEFTTERTDLEKELEEINADLEATTEMRAKEHRDYSDAKDEMQKAIAALDSASEVLKQATVGHEKGNLLAVRGRESFAATAMEAERLGHAAELGDRFLTKGDARFLRRLLTGGTEIPEWNWKKVNRKATFKMSYKARSFKIQDVLAKLLMTFKSNLAEANSKEGQANALFLKLKESKLSQKSAAEEALRKLEKENSVRGLSKAEANEELDALRLQISSDTEYVSQVQKAMAAKKSQWQARNQLRADELSAITKAISILHSDDARDLFKRSLKSQGYSLLQKAAAHSSGKAFAATGQWMVRQRLRAALAQISPRDHRVAALLDLASQGNFDVVLKAIDNMVAMLQAEEANELKTKEDCEANRMIDTREAILAARKMDEMSDTISSLASDIKDLDAEIAGAMGQAAEVEGQLKQAKRMRDDERAAYDVAKKDDEDAVVTVKQAIAVLEKFYQDNNLMLAQSHVASKAALRQAPGEAPPPPTTWEAPYGGKTNESGSIIAVLTMVLEDIEKDIRQADAAEQASIRDYATLKGELNSEAQDLANTITTLGGTKADKQSDKLVEESGRRSKGGELSVIMSKIAAAEHGCNYFTVNYPVRSKNRQIEVDGLYKARAILAGATFATPEDATRELKPGDAFLAQRARPHAALEGRGHAGPRLSGAAAVRR